jgi:NADH-quinone oxidoreductase subunit C
VADSPGRLKPAEIIDRLRARFGDDVPEVEEPHGQAVVRVAPHRYREVALTLRDDPDLDFDFFDFTTAVDWKEKGFDVVTQLYSTARKHHVRLKVACDRENPVCPSLHQVYPGANWFERETWELFGITFEGHPQLVKLVLPEQFEGFPARKEFVLMSRIVKPWPGAVEGEEGEEEE